MHGARAKEEAREHPGPVLTRALLRTARLLDLSQKDIAQIVGVSPASLSRLAAGTRPIHPDSKEGECALLLIRIYRALDALLGGRAQDAKAWFHAENSHLGGVPAQRVRTVTGLVQVADYLDAMRGKL